MDHIFSFFLFIYFLFSIPCLGIHKNNNGLIEDGQIRIATFDIDATPEVGEPLAYIKESKKGDLGLRAKGIVIMGEDKPIVLCAIDWIGMGPNGTQMFKDAVAGAARTTPDRVSIHVVHIHDAPRFNPRAEQLLLESGVDPAEIQHTNFDGTMGRRLLTQLTAAIEEGLKTPLPVNYMGMGEAPVRKIASNRTVDRDSLGKVRLSRFSSTTGLHGAYLRSLPEGTIDSMLSVLSFWNDDQPVAVLNFYATHPMSYYVTGVANPDFVGVARFRRQLALPDALQMYFTGAAGNVAAGKYNDGSHINRLILANRLEDAMERAWKSTKRQPITSRDLQWLSEEVMLPPAGHLLRLKNALDKGEISMAKNNVIASGISWLEWSETGRGVELSCLKLKDLRLLLMPGELFVEYQLAAKEMRSDLSVIMAAYNTTAPGYIGTKEAYEYGGYETDRSSKVDSRAEDILMTTMEKLLNE